MPQPIFISLSFCITQCSFHTLCYAHSCTQPLLPCRPRLNIQQFNVEEQLQHLRPSGHGGVARVDDLSNRKRICFISRGHGVHATTTYTLLYMTPFNICCLLNFLCTFRGSISLLNDLLCANKRKSKSHFFLNF